MATPPVKPFPIDGLQGTPSSRKALKGLNTRCSRMPENEKLCRRLYERLEFLHDPVAALDANDPARRKYIQVIVSFVKLARRTALLLRLANSETIVKKIKGMQQKLNEVQEAVGLARHATMTEWAERWDDDRAQQFERLETALGESSARLLVNEVGGGDKKLMETLLTLRSGIRESNTSAAMAELKTLTDDKVTRYWGHHGLECFSWFIPIENVEFEDGIGDGTFGRVSRGIWLKDTDRVPVVVKELFPENNDYSESGFLKQLFMWSRLPADPHILKLFGGSHVSTPQFYVCEDAHYGSLDAFLEDNSEVFWRLFLQVAQGIKLLHTQSPPIVHGGLKCNNILVGKDFTAKLTDFGFSTVRSLSASCSGEAASQKSVRWRPKEVLVECGDGEPLFASDIYSLGMCMIEALAQEPPFGMLDDDGALDSIVRDEMPERPEGVPDDTWNVITQLCHSDHTQRPTIDEVLLAFTARAEEEKKLSANHPTVPLSEMSALQIASPTA